MSDTPTHHDDDDIAALLARETHDGPGFESEDELPPSDFVGYENPDAEVEQ